MKRWFVTYLRKRIQYTKINYILGDGELIESGVPQGSVLVPILFIIYINDLFKLNLLENLNSFADDTSLVSSATTRHQLITNILNLFEKGCLSET